MEPNETDPRATAEAKAGARLAYEAPRIVEVAEFETLALACGKTSGPQCQATGGLTGS